VSVVCVPVSVYVCVCVSVTVYVCVCLWGVSVCDVAGYGLATGTFGTDIKTSS